MSTEIEVIGCGCRYRINPQMRRCEHLCDDHRKEFILKLFNEELVATQISSGVGGGVRKRKKGRKLNNNTNKGKNKK